MSRIITQLPAQDVLFMPKKQKKKVTQDWSCPAARTVHLRQSLGCRKEKQIQELKSRPNVTKKKKTLERVNLTMSFGG